MTEATTTPDSTEQTQQGDPAEVDTPLGENGEKALKAERDARKAAEAASSKLQKQLDDINAANLTDLEKAQKAATDAQSDAAKASVDAFREAAVTFGGISEDDAELYLTAPDKETLLKQAAGLVARKATGPKPDPSQGAKGGEAKGTTADMFAAAIDGAFTR